MINIVIYYDLYFITLHQLYQLIIMPKDNAVFSFDNFIVVPPIMYLISPIIIVQNGILIFYYYNDYCNFRATVKRKS